MKYTLVMRGNPRYPERGKKAYACAQYEKTLSVDELIDHIVSHGSSFRKGDYKAIISTLAEAMAEFNPDKHIKSVKVNWEPGDDFKNLKDKVTFREDLTRRMQKEALKADMERWNKEGE